MKIDYNKIKEELEKLSKKEILELGILLPPTLKSFYGLRKPIETVGSLLNLDTNHNTNFLPKEKAIKLVHSLKLKSIKEYLQWRNKYNRRDIPAYPVKIYKTSWLEFLNTGNVPNYAKEYLSLEEAIKIVHPLKFTSNITYKNWIRDTKRKDLPLIADSVYNTTWYKFLGKYEYLSLNEAKELLHPLKFSGRRAYLRWLKSNEIINLPIEAQRHYNVHWNELLGNNNISNRYKKFLPREEAIKIIHPLKFKGRREYLEFKKDNNREDLPSDPIKSYNMTWKEFLGPERHIPIVKIYISAEEAILTVHPLRFRNSTEYKKWRKEHNAENIPKNASKYYNKTWREFLGDNRYLSKEEAMKIVCPLKLKSLKEYIVWREENKRYDLPKYINNVYKVSRYVFFIKKVKGDKYLPLKEAQEIVHPLKFKDAHEYKKWHKDNNRTDLSISPNNYYNVSWYEILGKNK